MPSNRETVRSIFSRSKNRIVLAASTTADDVGVDRTFAIHGVTGCNASEGRRAGQTFDRKGASAGGERLATWTFCPCGA